MEIRFDTGRLSPEMLAQVGKYAVGLLAAVLLYKVYQVFAAARRTAFEINQNLQVLTPPESWRKSRVLFAEPLEKVCLYKNYIFYSKNTTIGHQIIDQNPFFTAAKVKDVFDKGSLNGKPYLISRDGQTMGVMSVGDQSVLLQKRSFNREYNSWSFASLKEIPVSMEYDASQVFTVTKEGALQEWSLNENNVRPSDTFSLDEKTSTQVLFAKRFATEKVRYVFVALKDGTFGLLRRTEADEPKWEKYEGYTGSITACTYVAGQVFIARGQSIGRYNFERGQETVDWLKTDHAITDLSFDKGQLYAVGLKGLTVWDFRRETQPGIIDQVFDRVLRLFG